MLGFPENLELNIANLTLGGHSLGAATTLKVAVEDDRFKCCVANDPWLLPNNE